MTTIVAIESGGDVEFATDSQVTWGSSIHNGIGKVFANGSVVFGVAGTVRGADLLRYMDIPKLPDTVRGRAVDRWVVTVLIPAISEQLEGGKALELESGKQNTNNHIILAVRGRAYYLSGELAVVRDSSRVYGVGSGSDFAVGAIHAGASAVQAVKIAARLDVYTGGRVYSKMAGEMVK